MRITLKKDNRTILHGAFVFWLISETVFEYTVISQAALLLFTGVSVIVVPKLRWSNMLTGYSLFVLWSVLNMVTGHATSRTTAMGMTRTVVFCLLFLYGLCCYYRYIGDIFEILTLYKWVIVAFAGLCLVGGMFNILSGQRLAAFGLNANTIAMHAGYALIVAVYEIMGKKGIKRNKGAVFVICILALTILFTGSRKGLIIPFLGIYLLISLGRPGKFLVYTLVAALVGCVMLLLLLNVPVLYNLIGYRIAPILRYLQGAQLEEASMEVRLGFIQLAWRESKNAPLWGHGLDCFRRLRYAYGTYSHCNYVEILYSLGWVGLTAYYAPFVQTLIRTVGALRKDRTKTVLLLALFVPFVLCDFMNITYFRRTTLLIPMLVTLAMPGKETER